MAKNWIADATKNARGQLAAKARAAGMSTRAFAEQHKDDSGRMGKMARLALTLMGMQRGRHKTLMGR